MTGPVSPWTTAHMSATASGTASVYQVGAGSQHITVNHYAEARPLDLDALRDWIDRLAEACAAEVAPKDRGERRIARHRAEVIDDLRRDLTDRPGKGKDCVRRLLATGVVQYHASMTVAPRKSSDRMVLDLLVYTLWPVIQAPRLPKGWEGHLVELTSPLIAQVTIEARAVSGSRRPVDVPLLTRALAGTPLQGVAANLLQDLGDPARGYGVVTAVATAARLPVPAASGAKALAIWLATAATGGTTAVVVDVFTGTDGDVTQESGTTGGRGGSGPHLSDSVDMPEHADALDDIVDQLFG